MFGRLFKRKSVVTEPITQPLVTSSTASAIVMDWPAQLDAARGDEDALTKLALSSAPHGIRLTAVQALADADALRIIEQAFRGRDKALYRAARQQLDTLARQKSTRATATQLLQEARQLAQAAAQHPVPANHLVELDQAWRALDIPLLEATQRSEFTQLQTTLAQHMREHSERQRDIQRQQAHLATERATQEAAARQAAADATRAQQQHEQERLQANRQAQTQAHQQRQQARTRLEAALTTLEDSLTHGQVADMPTQIAQLHELAAAVPMDAALQNRLQLLEAEYARLKGWQHWGREQAHLTLIEAAERLAATARTGASLKQHQQDIEQLRARWKALNAGAGATAPHAAPALWKRFDAALTLAWQPVAAQRQQLATARAQNLQARLTLLAELEAHPCPEPSNLAQDGIPATPGTGSPDWRALIRALDHFHGHWRKLGPLEHTISKHEQPALQTRLAHTLAMLEAPVNTARQAARQQRQQLIEQMRQLAHPHERDAIAKVQILQAAWQASTQAVPLPRKEEQALWMEFKAATDALFQQRTAARQARNDELAAKEAAQTTLIDQLHTLTHTAQDHGDPDALEQKLATLEQQWRELNRHQPLKTRSNDKAEAHFRSARQKVQQHIQNLRKQHWQAACLALLCAWQSCEQAVSLATPLSEPLSEPQPDSSARADVQVSQHVVALPSQIPAAWREALQFRCNTSERVTDDEMLDTTLLRLEALLELPTPEAFQATRRALKLQDMKHALETRTAHPSEHHTLESLLACALRLAPSQNIQSTRLHHILVALPQHALPR